MFTKSRCCRLFSTALGTSPTANSEFLNVDLDIRSRRSLAPLVAAWPWVQTPGLDAGRVPRWVVASPRIVPKDADAAIRHLVTLVDALPKAARRSWKEASSRTFDIGIQAGLEPRSFEEVKLREGTLKDITRLSARLLVTVYAPWKE
jgi:hypothetical protein